MTDTNTTREAPERIWLDTDFQPWRVWRMDMDLPEYIRAETAERDKAAAVAAAYERAASEFEVWCKDYVWHKSLANDLRALATPDQTDALEAVKAEAEAKGRMEAQTEIDRLRGHVSALLEMLDELNAESGRGID